MNRKRKMPFDDGYRQQTLESFFQKQEKVSIPLLDLPWDLQFLPESVEECFMPQEIMCKLSNEICDTKPGGTKNNIVLVHGPGGSGKVQSILNLAKQNNIECEEMNCADFIECGELLFSLEEYLSSSQLNWTDEGDFITSGKRLVVMTDANVLTSSQITEILTIVRRTKSIYPLFMVFRSIKPRKLYRLVKCARSSVEFSPPLQENIAKRLSNIARSINVRCHESALEMIAGASMSSYRLALTYFGASVILSHVRGLCKVDTTTVSSVIKLHGIDIADAMFPYISQLFQPGQSRWTSGDIDTNMAQMMVFENVYCTAADLDSCVRSLDSVSLADVMKTAGGNPEETILWTPVWDTIGIQVATAYVARLQKKELSLRLPRMVTEGTKAPKKKFHYTNKKLCFMQNDS